MVRDTPKLFISFDAIWRRFTWTSPLPQQPKYLWEESTQHMKVYKHNIHIYSILLCKNAKKTRWIYSIKQHSKAILWRGVSEVLTYINYIHLALQVHNSKSKTWQLYVPWRLFSYAGPAAWNCLPESIHRTSSQAAFKWQSKTFLYFLKLLTFVVIRHNSQLVLSFTNIAVHHGLYFCNGAVEKGGRGKVFPGPATFRGPRRRS